MKFINTFWPGYMLELFKVQYTRSQFEISEAQAFFVYSTNTLFIVFAFGAFSQAALSM
jgi:hypothetical protein